MAWIPVHAWKKVDVFAPVFESLKQKKGLFDPMIALFTENPELMGTDLNGRGDTIYHAFAIGVFGDGDECAMTLHAIHTMSGGNVNAQNNSGDTPLYVAVSRSNAIIVKTLLQCGADPTITNKRGDTPDKAPMLGDRISSVLEKEYRKCLDILKNPPQCFSTKSSNKLD